VLIGVAVFEGGNQGVAFVLDLTKRKQAEAEVRASEQRYREVQMELVHANRLSTIGQLTATIAHEINQPLGATYTNAQTGLRWLAADPPDGEEAKKTFTRIVRDMERATEVIKSVRSMVRKAPERREAISLNDLADEMVAVARGEAMRHNATIATELDPDLPPVQGDPTRLQQVLLNLIMNAIEAMREAAGTREIVVRTEMTDGCEVLVSIRDTGPGLSPEALEQVFQPFYTSKSSGMGMGLSICRTIVEAHGGRLWAGANQPKGAVFQFTVPAGPVL
jgi:C4-dicarboxylate-specific signal transduction histidine kinase